MDHSLGTTLTKRYRLVTRSDFDGLVCAALLRELDMLEDTLFVHPKDMQDGIVEITGNDITTNLPYVPSAFLAFDHHHSETERVGDAPANLVCDARGRLGGARAVRPLRRRRALRRGDLATSSWTRSTRPTARASIWTRSSIRTAGCCSTS